MGRLTCIMHLFYFSWGTFPFAKKIFREGEYTVLNGIANKAAYCGGRRDKNILFKFICRGPSAPAACKVIPQLNCWYFSAIGTKLFESQIPVICPPLHCAIVMLITALCHRDADHCNVPFCRRRCLSFFISLSRSVSLSLSVTYLDPNNRICGSHKKRQR
jgi:hypothetical protein